MALLNRPLTEAEARDMLATYYQQIGRAPRTLWDQLVTLCNEPTPHFVHYSVHSGVTYIPPTSYYWSKAPASPSDCTWIVPGTHIRKD